MDIFGGILSAFSLLGSLFNTTSQVDTNAKNIKFQREENEKNRQFNSAEAALARNFTANFSREMYQRQLNDNSMPSQISQYKQAGINPALAYSSGSFQGAAPLSVSSPAASSSGSISPNVAPQFDALTAAQVANINAQTKNIEAKTEGQEHENDILASDAKFRDAFNQKDLDLKNVNIDLGNSQQMLNDAEAHKARNEATLINNMCGKLLEDLKLVKAQINNVDADTIGKRIDNKFKDEHWRAQIDNLAAASGLSKAEVTSILRKLPLECQKLGSEIAVNNALASLTENQSYSVQISNDSNKIDLSYKQENYDKYKEFGDVSKGLRLAVDCFGYVLGSATGITSLIPK